MFLQCAAISVMRASVSNGKLMLLSSVQPRTKLMSPSSFIPLHIESSRFRMTPPKCFVMNSRVVSVSWLRRSAERQPKPKPGDAQVLQLLASLYHQQQLLLRGDPIAPEFQRESNLHLE